MRLAAGAGSLPPRPPHVIASHRLRIRNILIPPLLVRLFSNKRIDADRYKIRKPHIPDPRFTTKLKSSLIDAIRAQIKRAFSLDQPIAMNEPNWDPRPPKRPKLEESQASGEISEDGLTVPLSQASPGYPRAANSSSNKDSSKEIEVGITTFVNGSRATFHGVLKKRYTDFLVNEILPDGTVLHLQKTSAKTAADSPPKADIFNSSIKEDQALSNEETPNDDTLGCAQDQGADSNGPSSRENHQGKQEKEASEVTMVTIMIDTVTNMYQVSDSDRAKLVEYFNEEAVGQLMALYQSILRDPRKKSREHPTVRTPFTSDRTIRSRIHQDIRQIFHRKIDSSTDKDGILVLTAATSNSRGRGRPVPGEKERPGRLGWLDRGGEFLHFTLYKENKDTLEVISFLTKQLKTTNKTFQFAGTKDRRAVAVQRVSAYRIEAERLAAQNKNLHFAAVGDFQYQKQGLELGALSGNEFVVTLRDCQLAGSPDVNASEKLSATQSYLSQSLQSLREKGFLNFFGLQRFGAFTTRTDAVGVKILQGDFQAACDAILDFSPVALKSDEPAVVVAEDDRARAEGINIWRTTGKISDALDKIPRKFSAEIAVIRHLGRRPQDFLGALLSIQRNLRLMYVHAYQSLIWNLAVGERWKLFGSSVVEGDLVLVQEHKDKESKETGEEVNPSVDADGEVVIQPSGEDRAYDPDDIFERARPLSPAEAASGQYSIFDIVLPLPGFDVLYPANASGEWYKIFMATDAGGGLDPYNMRRKQKDFSLSGGYRKMLARISADYDVQVHEYVDDNKQFVETDMERLRGGRTTKTIEGNLQGEPEGEPEGEGKKTRSQPKLAAVLKFQLGSSQYATMALRELSCGGIQAYKPEFTGGK
ncbi:uncharacterized protein Z518_02421 [Rhinocladiella mackenziei CBS 650.93]|uniref:Rhinocladiella mackenziei CBS 650.93 unplaced genomic scaffold supercont1.2, whole genome shotgun sequence n=1 Tax=Rhinocladiella mackenziei CBS 650.93 TaxID=1442369 RepID=A0A0D2FZN1_9EURO|nr:uncharacterized protein Z518_02421 [Rhinocladiella mackenziei CBS 650.93]KIX07767.1 hypothetical protein Z518_02421 [Rhinocladiella mackenziei CBS 650.93]